MAERMLQFPRLPQAQPEKRPAPERAADFAEISRAWPQPAAGAQASRCSQCGVPFCSLHCPLGNNIPDWLKLVAEDRMEEAYEVASATNTFPEICGRICPQDRLCEGNCVIEAPGFGSVTIGAVEKHIAETAFANGWVQPPKPAREVGHSIGIIGAGPAGLAVAERLRSRGWAVDVYDRYDRVGGLLMYGIPGFKLEKEVVLRRWRSFEQGGIRFHLGVQVGRDVTLAELRAKHDAVFLGTGVYQAREIAVPGADLPGVVAALDYLTASNRRNLGDAVPETAPHAAGKRVVVVGGGDTAMDCVRTAVRQGAASVTCLYRRDRANMPGSVREVAHAEEEGVRFEWLAAPLAFAGEGLVQGVRAQRMHLGLPDAGGRQAVTPLAGSEFVLGADLVIKALGFDPEDLPALFGEPALAVTQWGTLRVGRDFQTALPGVFAGGDIVRGASLVVWAIRDGRDAAEAIEASVRQRAMAAAE